MKLIVTLILTISLPQICLGQAVDTIRVYDYLKPFDRWKLQVKNGKSFKLYANHLFAEGKVTGMCRIGDTTIQFVCDTSKLKNKSLTKDRLKRFTNIPFILCGDTFPKQNNFFIPRNIYHRQVDSIVLPKGIYARYYRGDGYGNNIIELKEDGTYIFTDRDCLSQFKEEGTWTLKKDLLTFKPKGGKWSKLEWITQDRQLYWSEDYLVGKKTSKTIVSAKKTIITETFFYLSKLPNL
jgi:hypothetical protein